MKVAHPFLWALLLFCSASLPLAADENKDPSTINPADVYFEGYLSHSEALDFRKGGKATEAFDAARRARRFLDAVALYHPEWKPSLVEKKREEINWLIEELTPEVEATANDAPLALYDESAAPVGTAEGMTEKQKDTAALLSRQIASLQARLTKSEDLRNADVARLQSQITTLKQERDELAASSLSIEVRKLRNRLDLVEEEKRALARQLADAHSQLEEASTRLSNLDTQEKLARQRANELKEMMDKEREVGGALIAKLRAEDKQVRAELEKTRTLLEAERQRTSRLETLLTEARTEVDSLISERDKIAKERDSLADLLQLNQGDRLQKLIEQNMTLARDLREARQNMEAISRDSDATREQLNEAKRDLAMAKDQIIQLKEEKENDRLRLLATEQKLRNALAEINTRTNLADLDADLREENRILREVIEKNLRMQKRRREMGDLVLTELAKMGETDNDEEVRLAVRQFLGEELTLTAEEQLMVDTTQTNGTFRFDAERASPEERRQAGARVRRHIEALENTIRRTYRKGKLNVAMELCEEILEEHPGHIPTMLNQGVIQFRMGRLDPAIESFENAVAMRTSPLPYAHHMLGAAHLAKGDLEKARTQLDLAIKLQPTNADAHNRLGVVFAQSVELEKAREHFEEAHKLNPQYLDPLFNLCVLHEEIGDKGLALDYYRQFRKAGGSPRPEMEKLIREMAPEQEQAANPEDQSITVR
ncbi:MAG: tetratricopeptide repeat protein [Verrucomicrobiota bacterium JB023]|nr:tetratricopeptide repeat protein [Verrucomicrobiota bacterium JB023]